MELVKELGLERYWSKFQLLGVRVSRDLGYVEDSDLIAFGCSTIERRKFFASVSKNDDTVKIINSANDTPEERARRFLAHYGPMTHKELQDRLNVINGGELPPSETLLPRIVLNGELLSLREDVWVFDEETHVTRIATFLQPKELIQFGMVSRMFMNSSHSKELWEVFCKVWFPRATMLDPDSKAPPETILIDSLSEMLKDGPKTLPQLMRNHGPSGEASVLRTMAAYSRFSEKADLYSLNPHEDGWGPVNPFRVKAKPAVVRTLDARRAFRLYSTGLLEQRPEAKRRVKPWQYVCHEGAAIGTLAPNDLLDLAQKRLIALHSSDPKEVHKLVKETIDGVAYHLEGCFNRRVQILLNGIQKVCLEKEEKKRWERKMIEYMERVKKERAFGYYYCKPCKSRWKSGFTYEAIGQECKHCNREVKPYRVEQLRSLFTPAGKRWDFDARGKVGKPMSFDGNAKSIDIYKYIRQGGSLHSFTFSAWVYPDEYRQCNLLQLDDITLSMSNEGSISMMRCSPSWPIKLGKWTHIVVILRTRTSTGDDEHGGAVSQKVAQATVDMYWDGQFACNSAMPPLPATARGQCFLGSGTDFFKGKMSHVMLWDCVLTPKEVQTVFATQKGMPKVDSAPLMALSIEPEDRAEVFTLTVESSIPVTGDFKKDLEVLATRFDVAVETQEWKVTIMGEEEKAKSAQTDLKSMMSFYSKKGSEQNDELKKRAKRDRDEKGRYAHKGASFPKTPQQEMWSVGGKPPEKTNNQRSGIGFYEACEGREGVGTNTRGGEERKGGTGESREHYSSSSWSRADGWWHASPSHLADDAGGPSSSNTWHGGTYSGSTPWQEYTYTNHWQGSSNTWRDGFQDKQRGNYGTNQWQGGTSQWRGGTSAAPERQYDSRPNRQNRPAQLTNSWGNYDAATNQWGGHSEDVRGNYDAASNQWERDWRQRSNDWN
eukprot:GEMP01007947.1.p1 GENE.GEMP01007947.1~~GEMP01007947.1.p1  ORF type:complete len:949 (+),score=152.74 GEMP01007947.1:23-2848(+)